MFSFLEDDEIEAYEWIMYDWVLAQQGLGGCRGLVAEGTILSRTGVLFWTPSSPEVRHRISQTTV